MSLKDIFVIVTHTAIAFGLTFAFDSLWAGSVVVAATICVLAYFTLRGGYQDSEFGLWLAIVGWAWIVFWLEFYMQSPSGTGSWSVKDLILDTQQQIARRGSVTFKGMHSLHYSLDMVGGETQVPSYYNFMRFVVCESALFVGTQAGAIAVVTRRYVRRGSPT